MILTIRNKTIDTDNFATLDAFVFAVSEVVVFEDMNEEELKIYNRALWAVKNNMIMLFNEKKSGFKTWNELKDYMGQFIKIESLNDNTTNQVVSIRTLNNEQFDELLSQVKKGEDK